MRKKRQAFLDTKKDKKHFDAFNVINVMLFFAVLLTFVLSLIATFVELASSQDKLSFVFSIVAKSLAILVTFVPFVCRKIFKIKFSKAMTSVYYLFLFVSLFLGGFINLGYTSIALNVFVQVCCAFLVGLLSLVFINNLFVKKQKAISPCFVALFVFCFSLAFCVCWESIEYICDVIFNVNIQNYANAVGQGALFDTMIDLCSDIFGAMVCAVVAYFGIKKSTEFVAFFSIERINKQSEIIETKENDEDTIE